MKDFGPKNVFYRKKKSACGNKAGLTKTKFFKHDVFCTQKQFFIKLTYFGDCCAISPLVSPLKMKKRYITALILGASSVLNAQVESFTPEIIDSGSVIGFETIRPFF